MMMTMIMVVIHRCDDDCGDGDGECTDGDDYEDDVDGDDYDDV